MKGKMTNGQVNTSGGIAGAGFGGLERGPVAGARGRENHRHDRQNFHTFQPLLYQVATAGLSPGEIAEPIRSISAAAEKYRSADGRGHGVRLGAKGRANGRSGIAYDSLIVAAGASHAISAMMNGYLSPPDLDSGRRDLKSGAAFCWLSNLPSARPPGANRPSR